MVRKYDRIFSTFLLLKAVIFSLVMGVGFSKGTSAAFHFASIAIFVYSLIGLVLMKNLIHGINIGEFKGEDLLKKVAVLSNSNFVFTFFFFWLCISPPDGVQIRLSHVVPFMGLGLLGFWFLTTKVRLTKLTESVQKTTEK